MFAVSILIKAQPHKGTIEHQLLSDSNAGKGATNLGARPGFGLPVEELRDYVFLLTELMIKATDFRYPYIAALRDLCWEIQQQLHQLTSDEVNENWPGVESTKM